MVTNVLRLVKNEESNADALDNVVAMHPVTELNLVELDNISEISSGVMSAAAESCVNGVCSLSWKPNRPSAA